MRDEELDSLFRNSIEGLDSRPPQAPNWNADETFYKIQAGLNNNGKKKYPGFFDLAAAAVVLLLSLGYLFSSKQLSDRVGDDSELLGFFQEAHGDADPGLVRSFFHKLKEFSPNGVSDDFLPIVERHEHFMARNTIVLPDLIIVGSQDAFEELSLASLTLDELTIVGYRDDGMKLAVLNHDHEMLEGMESAHKEGKFTLKTPVGLSYAQNMLAPVVGLQVRKTVAENAKGSHYLGLGVNSYHFLNNGEGRLKAESQFFAELAYGVQKKNATVSGHEFGLGYLMGGTDSQFNGRTFKLNYSISFKDKLQLSPELIFTDNFNKAIPSIRLNLI